MPCSTCIQNAGVLKKVKECLIKCLKDSVSWTTMIVGYAKSGEFDAACCVFDMMPNRDSGAWNNLISAYKQSGHPKEASSLFHELQGAATAKPDQLTLISMLSACSQLGAMDLGGWIHIYIKKQGLKLNCILRFLSLTCIDKALEVFQSMK
ncbi:hypothetical protein NE237_005181 [Protea cynaroides]|uniref:Pentatricopeptide repeat-containing protein n=1 Tax=Protea cynaroides TaxID=273540 RepID=A0A9Q0KK48_9MAGN|nr:hypothetical protein NE237_005181 [Protea cynaroides]